MGSASIWVLAAAGVVVLAAVLAALVGAAATARHRAGAAADLAALSAASRALEGHDPACRVAADVARASGALLLHCGLAGDVAEVAVSVAGPGPLRALAPVTARARAGPAPASG